MRKPAQKAKSRTAPKAKSPVPAKPAAVKISAKDTMGLQIGAIRAPYGSRLKGAKS